MVCPASGIPVPADREIALAGIHIELRQAIEPWHVLGEEPGGGGTARYVDSSVERLQVTVRGLTDPRFVVACNGRRVPVASHGNREGRIRRRSPLSAPGNRLRACIPPLASIHHSCLTCSIARTSDRWAGSADMARLASRRSQLCDVSSQCVRSRESSCGKILPNRSHSRFTTDSGPRTQCRFSLSRWT